MSFWKTALKTAPSESNPPTPSSTMANSTTEKPLPNISEKPLPDPTITVVTAAQASKRPGTSGTELALTSNRRAASQTFQAARRAERIYKARKRSAAARTAYASAKTHFGAAAHHFKVGVKLTVEVVRSVPYVVQDKRERKRAAAEERRARKPSAMEEKMTVADPHEQPEEDSAETQANDDARPEQQGVIEGEDETQKY
ncbi:hypothetical protein CONLIGDRAFT_269812 [Coniochaeta ligniaria NRRL 30616]|uniref:Uncharacterized protein n=1 Tax=Coniochaeta ligniaria NRRL 30616 TaxID=1408157 RepID=A0A1J7IY55_9PEZI|nr:hypothetical protein CONLIGDRAFT_269812 [Coniochaeta ligniaria NRRL 30616]